MYVYQYLKEGTKIKCKYSSFSPQKKSKVKWYKVKSCYSYKFSLIQKIIINEEIIKNEMQ